MKKAQFIERQIVGILKEADSGIPLMRSGASTGQLTYLLHIWTAPFTRGEFAVLPCWSHGSMVYLYLALGEPSA